MLKPMLMMLALLLMFLPGAIDDVAYVADDMQTNADTIMRNVACHLAGCYVVPVMPTLLPLLRHLML